MGERKREEVETETEKDRQREYSGRPTADGYQIFSAHIVCSRLCNGSFLLLIFTQQEKVVVTDRTRYIKLLPIILMCHNLLWFVCI